MPHTSRKKRPTTTKRLQISDPSTGWTHITTTTSSSSSRNNTNTNNTTTTTIDELIPAESPPKLTLPLLQSQFTTHKQKYDLSATAQTLRSTIQNIFFPHHSHHSEDDDNTNNVKLPTEIICIGLGSLSGLLRGGWVDRRRVSMYQLAALVGVIECFETHDENESSRKRIPIYAQDPVFNALDKDLLSSLNIQVVESPRAFDMVGTRTLLFCPGAERAHLKDMLGRGRPGVVVCSGEDVLEDAGEGAHSRGNCEGNEDGDDHHGENNNNNNNKETKGEVMRPRQGVKLPLFEEQESAFWGVGVYYY